jgi:hypothetical protein
MKSWIVHVVAMFEDQNVQTKRLMSSAKVVRWKTDWAGVVTQQQLHSQSQRDERLNCAVESTHQRRRRLTLGSEAKSEATQESTIS